MATIVIGCHIELPLDERGKLTTEAQGIHDALIDLLAKARKLAPAPVLNDEPVRAKRHIHRHDEGLPCVEEEDIADGARCVVDARAALVATAPKVEK